MTNPNDRPRLTQDQLQLCVQIWREGGVSDETIERLRHDLAPGATLPQRPDNESSLLASDPALLKLEAKLDTTLRRYDAEEWRDAKNPNGQKSRLISQACRQFADLLDQFDQWLSSPAV